MATWRPEWALAYQVGGRRGWDAVLRAGFGTFYDLGQGSLGGVTSYFPYGATKVIQPSPAPFPLSAQDAAPPAFSLRPPVNTIIVADPGLKLPRTYQWNVALEQSIGKQPEHLGDLRRRIGARPASRHAISTTRMRIFSSSPSLTIRRRSDYHALQLRFQRRLSRGLQGHGIVHARAFD